MTKREILEQIKEWLDTTKESEESWGVSEMGSYAYQKVYDFLEYSLKGDEDGLV